MKLGILGIIIALVAVCVSGLNLILKVEEQQGQIAALEELLLDRHQGLPPIDLTPKVEQKLDPTADRTYTLPDEQAPEPKSQNKPWQHSIVNFYAETITWRGYTISLSEVFKKFGKLKTEEKQK